MEKQKMFCFKCQKQKDHNVQKKSDQKTLYQCTKCGGWVEVIKSKSDLLMEEK